LSEQDNQSASPATQAKRDKLDKMIARLRDMDYEATAYAVAGQTPPKELEEEFLRLKAEVDALIQELKEAN